MKTNVAETSLLAYFDIEEELGSRQSLVLDAIRTLKACSNTMIAQYLNIPINCITPRVWELRERSLVTELKKDICPITKRNVIFWSLK
jgi:hypothetical protein